MNDCVFCNRAIKRKISLQFITSFQAIKDVAVCPKCLKLFQELVDEKACPGCSRDQDDQSMCGDCEKWLKYAPETTPRHTALFAYNEAARQYMEQFKFQGDVKLAEIFGEKLHHKLKPFTKTHIITVIPSSASSYRQRGFNGVELLLDAANIAHHPLLKHVTETEKQSSKTRSERIKSVQPFALISPEEMKGLERPVLVMDDVYTTGRTIFHARELLEKAVPTVSMSLFR